MLCQLFHTHKLGLIKDIWTIQNTFCFIIIIIITTPAVAAASEADGHRTLSAGGVRQC